MPKLVTEEDRQTMRQRIIHAAAAEFALVGFEQTKIEAIAERASVGKGTIYLYFASKEKLFVEMLEEIAREQLNELKTALEAVVGLANQIKVLLATFNRLVMEQPEAFQIFISSLYGVNRRFKQEAASQRRNFLNLIENLLEAVHARGELKIEVQLAALFVLNSCESLALMASSLGFPASFVQEREAELSQMLLAALTQ